SGTLRGIVAIDSLPDYSERAVAFLRTFAEKPQRRFAALEEAVASFRLLPRETIAKPEVLQHVARHSFRQLEDGAWTHKLDRRTLIREPLRVWDLLPKIECPALVVRIPQSPVLTRDDADKMVSALPHGRLAEIANSYHHVMLDNPDALIAVLKDFFKELP
ncbi:MAG TPA: alpha/beta hydrolase, partial [Candidatus Binataceae bacterium]|nr:alpha/beta hydrolase [Candidatus Binataceae bacterium]